MHRARTDGLRERTEGAEGIIAVRDSSKLAHLESRSRGGTKAREVGTGPGSLGVAVWNSSETLEMSVPTSSMLSLLDGSLKTATVGELAKSGITIDGLRDDMDPKEREKLVRIYRRKIANRESAKRSKIRKKAEDAKLLSATETLLQDAAVMRETITTLQKKVDTLYAENVSLRRRLGEKVNMDEEMNPPSVIEPVNVPPEVETPSLVVKEARKKKRGMLKSQSDSSIATTFEEQEYTEPAMKRVASVNTMNIRQGVPQVTIPPTQSKRVVCESAIREPFHYVGLFNDLEVPREGSPFLTNNYSMYDFTDGEFLGSADIMGFGL